MVIPALCLAFGAFPPLAAALKRTDRGTRNLAVLVALPVGGILNAGYIVLMGGDYVHGRLLVAPLFALVAPVAVVPLGRRYVVSLLVIPWALLCVDRIALDGRAAVLALAVRGCQRPRQRRIRPVWAGQPGHLRRSGHGSTAPGSRFGADEAPVRLQAPPAPGLADPGDRHRTDRRRTL